MVPKSVQKFALVVLLMFWASFAVAQRDGSATFSASDDYELDSINLVNLIPTLHIPVQSKTVGPLPGSIFLESPQVCRVIPIGGGTNQWTCGRDVSTNAAFYPIVTDMLSPAGVFNLVYTTSGGTCHQFTITGVTGPDNLSFYSIPSTVLNWPSTCGATSATVTTNDSTGYTFGISSASSAPTITSLTNRSGWSLTTASSTNTLSDAFSNSISVDCCTLTPSFNDSLGAQTTFGGVFPPTEYDYTDTSGTTQKVTFTTGSSKLLAPLQGITCGSSGNYSNVTPITSINYPDGTSVGLTWLLNGTNYAGLVKSFTLRTGGTVTYTYGDTSGGCSNWGYATLSRATSDGTTSYSMSTASGITTTTVKDPGLNKTVYVFNNTGGTWPNFMPMIQSVDRYQNTGSVGTPAYTHISETLYCYNTSSNPCTNTPAYPITQRDIYEYTYTSGGTQVAMSHDEQTYDNTYGLLLTDAATDSITSQTITTTYVYGTDVSGTCSAITNTAVVDHPCTITTKNGSTWLSGSTYTYNSNGALTASSACLSSTCTGSSALTTTYTPTTQGTYSAIAEPNGQSTSYTYGSCNSLMPTDVTTTVNSIAIDHKATWNCNAGVVTDTTDANSNEADYTYDSMNRPSTYHDYMGDTNTTSWAYGTPTLDHVKVTDNIGVVSYQYVDGLGRPLISQIYNGTNYDTVSHTYGWTDSGSHALTNFQTTTSGGTSSAACTAALDTACTNVTLTALTNPIAGPYKTTDANSGTGTYAINSKDWSFTAGPAPSGDGENTKVVQTEVDGFGRITSTCALEASGGTSCGQTMGNSGILNSNTYSFPSAGVSEVQTTRGSQTHTTKADALGRVTSVATPEAGTVTTTYDDIPANTCASGSADYPQAGDLSTTVDAASNKVCYYHDAIHRVIAIGNNNQSATNPCRRFAYDSTANKLETAPTGYPSSGNNLLGRLMEAETDDCTTIGTNLKTDEWFAYDKMGRMTDMWQCDTKSSCPTYIHTTVTYDADGNVLTLGGIPNVSTLTYTVDTEGRWKTATLGASTTVVSAVTYDAASAPTEIDIGSSTDKDKYSWDQLGNMTQYQFFVGSNNNKGVLTWNSIGSLASLAITDGLNTNNTQTCNFGKSGTMGYDDVGRLLDDDCGTVWAQTYSYDQYDNMKKSGNLSYNPTYTASNNHDSLVTYDSGGLGNIVTDAGGNTYTWTVYGQMASENSKNATYDAFGRRVVFDTYEYLYSPMGKLGTLSSGSPYTMTIPVPGGGMLDARNGSNYYYHKDWMGSSRTASTLGGTLAWSKSFSPYGDPYNSGTDINYQFSGMIDDTWTGLTYSTPNRELGFTSAHWMTPDPAYSGWNAYAYVTDPNTQTDPSGLQSVGVTPFPDCRPDNTCKTDTDHLAEDVQANAILQAHEASGIVGRWNSRLANAWHVVDMNAGFVVRLAIEGYKALPETKSTWPFDLDSPCKIACAAAARKGGAGGTPRSVKAYTNLRKYRTAREGWWGDHWLNEMQLLAGGYGTNAEKAAATDAIESFMGGKNNMERLIRGNSVLREHFDDAFEASMRGERGGISGLGYEFGELRNWDPLMDNIDVSLQKAGTWFDHPPTSNRFPTAQSFIRWLEDQ